MMTAWEKPDFEEISVSAECTAYSGSRSPVESALGRTVKA